MTTRSCEVFPCCRAAQPGGDPAPSPPDSTLIPPPFFPCSGHGGFSLNAAMLAAAICCSRLPSTGHVFALLLVAVQVFALLPMARDAIRERAEGWHLLLTAAVAATTLALLVLTSTALLAALYAAAVFGVTLVCPLAFISLHANHKSEITGPWDEASIVRGVGAARR
jgi:hypothetical protein